MVGQGNLETTWKVREKSGNLKIKLMATVVFRNYIYFVQGEIMYFLVR